MPADLTDIVRRDGARYLTAYFAEPPARTYTGRWFETLAGGGDRDDAWDRLTGDDLIAVEMLDVEFPAAARWDLIDGALGAKINEHLANIPRSVEITDPEAAELFCDKGDANQAHESLKNEKYDGRKGPRRLGYVIAGKLLARKRPYLIPVYDSRIKCQFGRPDAFWISLYERFTGDGGALRAALVDARSTAGVSDLTSVLRALDVVLWMRHEALFGKCRTTKSCLGYNTVSLTLPPVGQP
ncbi:DUF6308 family protein [Actinoplanes sp. NBC_00393]|uniref:DUF6308 family protein n=1 Tax=Actinoplanes sp. NBC_00393 TaxID=2975953 RepID=UPI002E1D9BBB